ncbi:hypothetical protein KUTeg_006769 [Tegillarca granosa]|uniref:Tetratricopeptide repeat protein n=1 Tax=Tegillarca granosa TaxID=220873 RepID=A0ABQ9FB96_TEGGR|nr:hypothetical protein KUTeg_006769 [Tegillarca granosa]
MGIHLLQEALKFDPHNIDGLLAYGGMMAETQNWNEAERIFKIALEERPDLANVYHNYGTYLQKRGMVAEAVEYYKIAYNIDERHSASMVNAAKALNQLGKNKEAENIVNRALAIHRDSSTLDVLGIIYYDSGQLQKSVSVFEEIKQQAPNNTDAILHYVHVLSDLDEFDKAEALLHQILNTEPYHIKALREMAVLLALKNKHEEALPYIGLAVSKCKKPEMLQKLLFQQGNHYKDLKRYGEALKSYNEIIKYDPKHVQAHLNIGGIHHLYARLEKARHHYQITLKLDPGNSLATSNLARLQKIENNMKSNG